MQLFVHATPADLPFIFKEQRIRAQPLIRTARGDVLTGFWVVDCPYPQPVPLQPAQQLYEEIDNSLARYQWPTVELIRGVRPHGSLPVELNIVEDDSRLVPWCLWSLQLDDETFAGLERQVDRWLNADLWLYDGDLSSEQVLGISDSVPEWKEIEEHLGWSRGGLAVPTRKAA